MTDGEDPDADDFEVFVVNTEPTLRRALVAAYGNDVGREATAEALAYAWEHWTRVSAMENPQGYLYRVGQSKARRYWYRPRHFPPSGEGTEIPWIEPGLGEALRFLSVRQRQCVVLVHAMGLSNDETTELLGIAVSSVQTHLDRALSKLRRKLKVSDEHLLDYFDSIAEPVTADEARDRARRGRPSPRPGSLAIAAAAVAVVALVVVLNLLDQTAAEVVAPTGATSIPTSESQPPTTEGEPPEPIWMYQGVSPGWMLDPGIPVIANPDLLTAVNEGGNEVFALELETGTERWRTSVTDQTILLGGTASAVIAGDPDSVASLDAWTGDVQWRTELGSRQHPNGLAVTEDRVFISHDCPLEIDNKPLPGIVGLDRRSGAVVWETTLSGLEASDGSDFELRIQPSGLTIADDALLVSVTRGAFALDAGTGDIRWVVEYGLADLDDLEGLYVPGPGVPENFNPAPIWVDGDTGYFPDPDGELVAIDIPSGDVVFAWEAPYGPVMALGKAGAQLLLADSDGVHAIDSTDSAVWDVEVEDTEAATYYEGVIFAANRTGIAAITLDGEIQWQRALRDDPRYFVEGVDEGVVVAGESEVEYLDGTTGATRWATNTGAYAAPIAIDDKLVVVDSNGTISVYPRDVLR